MKSLTNAQLLEHRKELRAVSVSVTPDEVVGRVVAIEPTDDGVVLTVNVMFRSETITAGRRHVLYTPHDVQVFRSDDDQDMQILVDL